MLTVGYGERSRCAVQRASQTCERVDRQRWKVAGRDGKPVRGAGAQRGQQPGQRSAQIVIRVGDHGCPLLVDGRVAIGADKYCGHLRAQTPQRVQGQRLASKQQEAFVGAAHAATASAGEQQAGDVACGRF